MSQADRVVVICNLQAGTYAGSNGFIGRELVSQLGGKVASLVVVGWSVASDWAIEGARYVNGDAMDADRMLEVLDGATVVYQLTTERDFVIGARNVAEACLRHKIRRLIFNSTCEAVYLGRRGRIDESAGHDAEPHLRNPYARAKVESEKLLLQYHEAQGLPIVIVRPCITVGRGGPIAHGGIGTWRAPTCLVGWGNGKNLMPFVLVQDVASALILAMDAPNIDGKAFNVGGDVFLSAREYVRLVGEHTLRNFRFYPRNLMFFNAKIVMKAIIKRLLRRNGQRQYYRDILSSAMFSQIDNQGAKKALGWQPNADLNVFIREAIDCHVPALDPGDLRLTPPASSGRFQKDLDAKSGPPNESPRHAVSHGGVY